MASGSSLLPVQARALPRLFPRPYLWGPAALVATGVLVPLGYLVVRAFEAEPGELAALLLRWRNLRLLGNTLGLTAGVLAAATALALQLAECEAPPGLTVTPA